LALLQRRPDAKSFYSSPSHSIVWKRCTDPLFIQPCIRSTAMTKKSAPARGGGWDALEAPPAKRPGEFAS
jgi:hypothetical protein